MKGGSGSRSLWERLSSGTGLTREKGEGEEGGAGWKSLETPWPCSWGASEPRLPMGGLGQAGAMAPAPVLLGPRPPHESVLGPEGTGAAGCQPTKFLLAGPLLEGA